MSWSSSKGYVFQSFKYALGAGYIKKINYDKLKVNITDSNFLNTNICRIKGTHKTATEYFQESDSEKVLDYNNLRLNDLKKLYKWNELDGYGNIVNEEGLSSTITPTNNTLYNTNINSFNKDDGYSGTVSFEQIDNMPCSARIFSNEHDDSWVTHDLDWSVVARHDNNLMKYFQNEYNFKNEYDNNEYNGYGVNENILDENVIRLSADPFEYKDKNSIDSLSGAMAYGAGGILLTYNDGVSFTGENELPVAYYDFGSILHSNYNYLHVDWHEDGVIKVE